MVRLVIQLRKLRLSESITFLSHIAARQGWRGHTLPSTPHFSRVEDCHLTAGTGKQHRTQWLRRAGWDRLLHVRHGGSAIILPLLSMSLQYKRLHEGEVAACDEPCKWSVRVGLGHMADPQHLEEVDRVPGRLISKEDGSQLSSVFVPGTV